MKRLLVFINLLLLIFCCSSSKDKFNSNFSKNEVKLITSSGFNIPMRVYKITNTHDSILLRSQSSYIKPNPNNATLNIFIKRLYATVRDSMSLGVGIAAPQVGVLKNIIWVQRFDKENFPFEVYLNPKITYYSKQKQIFREGCLSIPNRVDTVKVRAQEIILEYDTVNAEHKIDTVKGFTSVIFQHEIDHLNGILYLDHLEKDIKTKDNP